MKKLIIFTTVLFLVIGCKTEAEKVQYNKPSRFVTLETFKVFSTDRRDSGKIIKDKVTGECYLYYWAGSGNGGPSLAIHSCNKE